MRDRIREILQKEKKRLLKKEGVISIASGIKIIDGKPTGTPCITVSVEKKLIPTMVKRKDLIPTAIDSILTDVIESNIIKALHTQRHRPVPGGVSGGHKDVTGTLGGLARQGVHSYILSNNHVLALSNKAEIGDPIIQPGGHDGGEYPRDHVADLIAFVPINMGGVASDCPFANVINIALDGLFKMVGSHTRFKTIRMQEGVNLVDAALATPLNPEMLSPEIFKIGEVKGIVDAKIGMEIQGSSRTSGLRFGTIDQIDAIVKVQYGGGMTAVFEDQLISNTMQAEGGDSGTYIISVGGYLAGLLFAGSKTTMVANRIQNVVKELNLQF
jgi:hypothetical protein